jgi:hypothetical protein
MFYLEVRKFACTFFFWGGDAEYASLLGPIVGIILMFCAMLH